MLDALEELVDPSRVTADLLTLHEITSDERGAQRVAWTSLWQVARTWLCEQLAQIGAEWRIDPAGNLWAAPADARKPIVYAGSHLDSVPDGGRYDGALGVLAALEILRAAAQQPRGAHDIGLVDFADEEGARFGYSLFGSSALVGKLDVSAAHSLSDHNGSRLVDVVAAHGVNLEAANDAAAGLADVLAYIELHVEQGTELESRGVSVAAVSGASGIYRLQVRMLGETTHAGGTPMAQRRDPMLAAAESVTEIAKDTQAVKGLATFGRWEISPSIATAVPASVEFTVDLRHEDERLLAHLVDDARQAVQAAAGRHRCEVQVTMPWRMSPEAFDPDLVDAAAEAARWAGGTDLRVVSARGHDAVVLAQRLPVAMLFCPSTRGLSHNPNEHTDPSDIARGVRALARLVGRVAAGTVAPRTRHEIPGQEPL